MRSAPAPAALSGSHPSGTRRQIPIAHHPLPAVSCNKVSATPSGRSAQALTFLIGIAETSLLCDIAEMALLSHFPTVAVSGEKLQQSDGQCGSAKAVRNENARDPLDECDRLFLQCQIAVDCAHEVVFGHVAQEFSDALGSFLAKATLPQERDGLRYRI